MTVSRNKKNTKKFSQENQDLHFINIPSDIFILIIHQLIFLDGNVQILSLVCKYWDQQLQEARQRIPGVLLDQIQYHLSLPKSQRKPLLINAQLCRLMPAARKYCLGEFVTDEDFAFVKEIIKDRKKSEIPDKVKDVSLTLVKINGLINKLHSKTLKGKVKIAKKDEIVRKMKIYVEKNENSNAFLKKNLLNVLLLAFVNKNQARIYLSLLKYYVKKEDLTFKGYYVDPNQEFDDDAVPKIFYDMLTVKEITPVQLAIFKRVLNYLQKMEDGISDNFNRFYSSFNIREKSKFLQPSEFKFFEPIFYLNLPNFSYMRHSNGHDFSYGNLPGFRLVGCNNANLNFFHSNLKNSIFSGGKLSHPFQNYNSITKITHGFLNFAYAELDYSQFKDMYLYGSFFNFANLKNTALIDSNIEYCDFSGANLRKTNWTRSQITQCNFLGADLHGAFNEILKINLKKLIPGQGYSNDWIKFKKKRKNNSNLVEKSLNHAILLPLWATINSSAFDDNEKYVLQEVIKEIDRISIIKMEFIFDLVLQRSKYISQKLLSLFEFLYVQTLPYRVQNELTIGFDIKFIEWRQKNSNHDQTSSSSSSSLFQSPQAENQSMLDASVQISENISLKIANKFNMAYKKLGKKPIVFEDDIIQFLKSKVDAKPIDQESIYGIFLHILIHAMLVPSQAKICLDILKIFISKDKLSYTRYYDLDREIKDEDLPKILFDALTTKQLHPNKTKIFSKAFLFLHDKEYVRISIFDRYARFYEKLDISKQSKNKRGIFGIGVLSKLKKKYLPFIFFPKFIVDGSGKFIKGKIYNKNFSYTDMRGISFFNCHFINCNFSGADLRGVNFSETEFLNCNFSGADLRGVDLTGTKFSNCNFEGATIDGWGLIAPLNMQFSPSFNPNLNEFPRNLQLQNLQDFDYSALDLKHCMADGKLFVNTKFDNSLLSYATFMSVNSSNCSFYRASMDAMWFSDSFFYNCNFANSKLSDSHIQNVYFSNCNFNDVDFSLTVFKRVSFINCTLRGSYNNLFSISDSEEDYTGLNRYQFKYFQFQSDNSSVTHEELNSAMLLALWHEYIETGPENRNVQEYLYNFIGYFYQFESEMSFSEIVHDFRRDNETLFDITNPKFSARFNNILSYLSAQSKKYLIVEDSLEDDSNFSADFSEESSGLSEDEDQVLASQKNNSLSTTGFFSARKPVFYFNQSSQDPNEFNTQSKKRKFFNVDSLFESQSSEDSVSKMASQDKECDEDMDVEIEEPLNKKPRTK